MAEVFLEEQLKRIREMSEQMSRLRNRAAELGETMRNGSVSDEPLLPNTGEEAPPRRQGVPATPRRRPR